MKIMKTQRITENLKKNLKKISKIVVLGGFFSFIIIYSFFRVRDISSGVNLTINGIESGKTYEDSIIEVTGTAKRANKIEVNGLEITRDIDGNFDELLVLSPGYNIITIVAEDKFGKETKEVFEVIKK